MVLPTCPKSVSTDYKNVEKEADWDSLVVEVACGARVGLHEADTVRMRDGPATAPLADLIIAG